MSLTGDVYADLLNAAAEVSTPRPLAMFKGKVVEIYGQEGPNYTRVNYQGDEEHRAFSAPTKDLKPYGLNTIAPKPDTAAPQLSPADKSLESYIESVGCTIWVEAQEYQVPHVRAQIQADLRRALTPEEENYIKPHGKKMTNFPPEWRVAFKAPDQTIEVNYPHDDVGGMWRINYRDLVRDLLSRGATLGKNAPK